MWKRRDVGPFLSGFKSRKKITTEGAEEPQSSQRRQEKTRTLKTAGCGTRQDLC